MTEPVDLSGLDFAVDMMRNSSRNAVLINRLNSIADRLAEDDSCLADELRECIKELKP